jgi:hypothetical protein
MKNWFALAGLAMLACAQAPSNQGAIEGIEGCVHIIPVAKCGPARMVIVRVALTEPAEITWPVGWQPVIEQAWWKRIWRWAVGAMMHTAWKPGDVAGEPTISITLSESVTGLLSTPGPLQSLAYCGQRPKPEGRGR